MSQQLINPIETARLAAGILNVSNLTQENIKIANDILERSLKDLDNMTRQASLIEKGIIT